MPSIFTNSLPLTAVLWLLAATMAPAADPAPAEEPEFTPEQIEFFEKQVRPILVNRCYECHSAQSKEVRGGLRLDSRAAALAGGDTGPAVVPGDLPESLLIDAVNYGDLYQMPPKSKLPAAEIAALVKWVEMNAPWPAEQAAEVASSSNFDLQHRAESHWAWREVTAPPIPPVLNGNWPRDDLDRFILARLEAEQRQPAPPAARPALVRRLYFDLTGLPPTPAEVEAFLADESPQAYAQLVDRLLESPRFGERWARHWLDLVRYAESRGHEFDYDAPNAYQYRDYVIRALNADAPYDQFVREHIAGDLLEQPRTNPETGANESILGTGFWFLGEWLHSPVDLRKDEADRFDNMIDVFSKTFLAMTVACARCHDHKFDAISHDDYYALAGFLQSSTYRQVRFESMLHNRQIARELKAVRDQERATIAGSLAQAMRPVVEQFDDYLLAAREAAEAGPLTESNSKAEQSGELVIADFESGDYQGWQVTGDAFGPGPQTLETIASYQGQINAMGRFFVNSHNKRSESAKGDEHTGTLTSAPFTIERNHITLWVGGGSHEGKTCVNLLVDGQTVRTATGRNNNQMVQQRWQVEEFRGREARIEIVDQATGNWGNVGVDHIVQTDFASPEEKQAHALAHAYASRCEAIAQQRSLDQRALLALTVHLLDERERDRSPLAAWQALAAGLPERQIPEMLNQLASRPRPSLEEVLAATEVVVDYSNMADHQWIVDGPLFGDSPLRRGAIIRVEAAPLPIEIAEHGAARRDPFWNRLQLAPGTQNDPGRTGGWVRAGATLRTPTFTINQPVLHYLVRGAAKVYVEVDSHRVNQGPLHGSLISEFRTEGELRWVSQNVERYRGHGANVEFSAIEDSPLEILAVVQAPRAPEVPRDNLPAGMAAAAKGAQPLDAASLAGAIAARLAAALEHFAADDLHERAEVELMSWMLERPAIFLPQSDLSQFADPDAAARRQELSKRRMLQSHTALAMWDSTGVDEHLFIRGNHKTLGKVVPRRTLSALAAGEAADYGPRSGRLQLAEQLVSPRNPLVSRVIVNRIWGHLFVHGLVRSVDNFGALGEEPSHPELLDHLAVRFMHDGWSLKRLIRSIVLSSTYQMASSSQNGPAEAADPGNRLLHRQNIRRLEGEALRDSILAVSGRLDTTMYGPSVPVHLTEFLQGRGRPPSGPLDGDGRRSIYLSVRRNFLSPMMLAFDTPIPFTTVGRRNVSNVPAQALILLNDPFVIEEARRWARKVMASSTGTAPRIEAMYQQAFARGATERETAAAAAFIVGQGAQYGLSAEQAAHDERVWGDLAHVLLNAKEFVFIR